MNWNKTETHPLFPSGEWEGFYTYAYGPGANRHPMTFFLDFNNKQVTGGGGDDVGAFSWNGAYDTKQLICQMTKNYTTHLVQYKGNVDESGIWGTWMISDWLRGGFHIWPKNSEERKANEEKEKVSESIELDIGLIKS